MNVEYLIQLLGNRLTSLATAKEQAFLTGDLDTINTLDSEANGVLDTLNKLKLLQGISQTASVTPFTEAEVVQNGIQASFGLNNPNTVFNGNSTGCLLGYDISSYATDPLHEQKIADILNYMGNMDSPTEIDIYINSEAIASPVTGAMVFSSARKYNVDARLMMALMELDSRFGTVGVAIRTLNPGNVGNDDSGQTHTYSSWNDGVDAVASWLNNHRINTPSYKEAVVATPVVSTVSEVVPVPAPIPAAITEAVSVPVPETPTTPTVESTPSIVETTTPTVTPEVTTPDTPASTEGTPTSL